MKMLDPIGLQGGVHEWVGGPCFDSFEDNKYMDMGRKVILRGLNSYFIRPVEMQSTIRASSIDRNDHLSAWKFLFDHSKDIMIHV